MAKSDRDDVLSTLAARLFAAMVDDVVMDAALQSHQEVARNRAVCEVCHTKCGQAHASGSVALAAQGALGMSRQGTPVGEKGAGTSTPTARDGTIYLECVNCSRQMASNRYASHLSSCMGLGTGARRGAARSVNVKTKVGESARSASPYLGSESGNVSDDSGPPHSQSQQAAPKKKGRPPKKKDEGETASNRKRPGSPQVSPNKNKKQKTNGSPLSRVRTEKTGPASNTLLPPPPTTSQSKVPSRLRESSTASFLEHEASSSSRSSSPATLAASSAHSAASFGAKLKKNGMVGKKSKPGVRLPSPPRPPRPPTPVMRRPETDYLVDVEGDETGSSTDTDSE